MADKCFSQYVHSLGGGQIFGSADKRQHFFEQKERPYLESDREAIEILTIGQLGLHADCACGITLCNRPQSLPALIRCVLYRTKRRASAEHNTVSLLDNGFGHY
jgi:hypothetical protein